MCCKESYKGLTLDCCCLISLPNTWRIENISIVIVTDKTKLYAVLVQNIYSIDP